MAGRCARYSANHAALMEQMTALGFVPYLRREHQSPIITTFLSPQHPNFDFRKFYDRLHEQGHVIYFGKVTSADCFRIGNIGRLFAADIDDLLGAIGRTLEEMEVEI